MFLIFNTLNISIVNDPEDVILKSDYPFSELSLSPNILQQRNASEISVLGWKGGEAATRWVRSADLRHWSTEVRTSTNSKFRHPLQLRCF
jgi:hypothetical protein